MKKPKSVEELEQLTTEELEKEYDDAWKHYKKVKHIFEYRLLCEAEE